MRIIQRGAAALLASMALVLSGAPAANAQTAFAAADLVGSWLCIVNTGTGVMNITTTYHPGGRFVSLATSHDESNGRVLDFAIIGEGVWSVQVDQLTETGSRMDLIWARLGAQGVIPGTEPWNIMNNALQQSATEPNVRTIEALTPTDLSVNFQGHRLTCGRP